MSIDQLRAIKFRKLLTQKANGTEPKPKPKPLSPRQAKSVAATKFDALFGS